MKVYQYDTKGYYIGETTAHCDLMPHNTTTTAPKQKTGFVPRWTGSKWEQTEDHKGETGYAEGVYTEIKEYGPLPEGWSAEAPEPERDATQERITELKAYLAATDYIVVKMAESGMTKAKWLAAPGNENYADIFARREAARAELAEL